LASIDLLAIGHVTRDRLEAGFTTGGTVTYGALAARALGSVPAIVTSVGPDLISLLPDVDTHVVTSTKSTAFRNDYGPHGRTQHVESVARHLSPSDVPQEWQGAPAVLLGPLVGEVDAALARFFPNSLVVASVQGWLRRWDSTGLVTPRSWSGLDVLPYLNAAVVSIDDIVDEEQVALWADIVPVLVVTHGAQGARLHTKGRWHTIPAFAAQEVDPTGAGDVFAAAFALMLLETGDSARAATFASCVASFAVEAQGTSNLPTRAQVDERLASG
jgi:1D-myo-inositol 3-kinase